MQPPRETLAEQETQRNDPPADMGVQPAAPQGQPPEEGALSELIAEAMAAPASVRPSHLRRFFKRQFDAMPSLAVLTAIGAALLIGLATIFVRLSEAAPIATAFHRFFLAGPFLITWMMYDNVKDAEARLPTRPAEYALMVLAGLFFALDLTCWHLSITMTSVVNAAMFNNMTAVFVPFLAWIIFGSRPTLAFTIGVLVAVCGAMILASQGGEEEGSGHLLGDLLAILSAVMFAGYILIKKYLRERYTAPTVMAWTSLPTMYFLALFAIFEDGNFFPTTLTGWFNLLALGLVVHVFGQGLMAYAMRHISAGFSAVVLLLGPIVASFIAWPLFDEPLNIVQAGGICVILCGIVIAQKSAQD